MKVIPHRLTLLLALALGSAGAQNTTNDGTLAGTSIENVAHASFFDPSTSATATLDSNKVTTEVLPKPGFDIVYFGGSDGLVGSTVSPGNTVATAPATATGTATPGGTYSTAYMAVNNGNTVQTISLNSDSTGAKAPTVTYYLDDNKDGILQSTETTVVNSLSLPYDDPATPTDEGVAYFIQVITLPTSAAPGDTYAATPVGTGQVFNTTTLQPETVTETTTVLGLQYAVVTVANQPPVPADVTNTALLNTAGATALSPLVATDDGSVASYTIQTLPDPASGVLYYNGSPVTAGQTITDPTKLTFDPADGFVGNATFDYTATDNLSLGSTSNKNADGTVTSGAATYTIPVQAPPTADLRITKLANNKPNSIMVAPNQTVYYYIRVTNDGPSAVTGAVVQDTMPAGMTWTGTSCINQTNAPGNTCVNTTAPAPTVAQLQSGYTLPVTLQPGQFFEFYVTTTVTAPNVTGTVYNDNTATVTLPATFVDPTPANNTSTARVIVDAPPLPQDKNNSAILNTAGQVPLDFLLMGTDADGTITNFTITALPTSGTLYYNGTPVTVGQVIPATNNQASGLTYAPLTTYLGTVSFSYSATDNLGAVSKESTNVDGSLDKANSSALYTIPIVATKQPLTCSTTVYGLFATGTNLNALTEIRSIDPSGNLSSPLVAIPSASKDVAAFAISPDGSKLYITAKLSTGEYVVQKYDMATGTWTTLATLVKPAGIISGTRPVRMTIDQSGNGYISSSNYIWTFNSNTDTVNTTAAPLTFNGASTGLNPVPSLTDTTTLLYSGDFIADADGNLYLLANSDGSNYLDVYRIQSPASAAPVVTYVSRLPVTNTKAYAGMAPSPAGSTVLLAIPPTAPSTSVPSAPRRSARATARWSVLTSPAVTTPPCGLMSAAARPSRT